MSCSPHVRRGGNLSLSAYAAEKAFPPLKVLTAGLGWAPSKQEGAAFDLDASALCVMANGKILTQEHFVFFNNLVSPDGSVRHTGDNTTGAGEGDDEQLIVTLNSLPAEVVKVVFVVSIYDAEAREQSFGQVKDAYIRIYDDRGNVLTRYDLTNSAGTETAMVFGEIYRVSKGWRGGTEWKFRAIGQGYDSGLAGIATDYGAQIA